METNVKKELLLSRDENIAGVIAGVAEYLGINTTFARILYATFTLLTALAPGVVLYVILLYVMVMNENKRTNGTANANLGNA